MIQITAASRTLALFFFIVVVGFCLIYFQHRTWDSRTAFAAEKNQAETATAARAANLRKKPSMKSKSIRKIKKGERVEILKWSKSRRWAKMRLPDGTTGWSPAKRFKVDKKTEAAGEVKSGLSSDLRETCTIKKKTVIRKKPKGKAKKIRRVRKGEAGSVLKWTKSRRWVKLELEDGTKGWLPAKRIEVDKKAVSAAVTKAEAAPGGAKTCTIRKKTVIRKKPKGKAKKIRRVGKGEAGNVLKWTKSRRWVKLELEDGTKGWLPAKRIELDKAKEQAEEAPKAEAAPSPKVTPEAVEASGESLKGPIEKTSEETPDTSARVEFATPAMVDLPPDSPDYLMKYWGISWAARFNTLTPVEDAPNLNGLIFLEPAATTGGGDWRLIAVDAGTGEIRWIHEPEEKAARTSNIIFWKGDILLAISTFRLIRLSLEDGRLLEEIRLTERNAGLLAPCEGKLCIVQAGFEGRALYAARNIFLRPLPRKVSYIEIGVYDLDEKKFIANHPVFRLDTLPAQVYLNGRKLVVIDPQGSIEVFDLKKGTHEPLKRYQLRRPRWRLDKGRLSWLESNQLFNISPEQMAADQPIMMPTRSRDLLATNLPRIFFVRARKGGDEIWFSDLEKKSFSRVGDWNGRGTLKCVAGAGSLLVVEGNRMALFDTSKATLVISQHLPLLESTEAKPIYSDGRSTAFAVETEDGVMLIGMAPYRKMKEGSGNVGFGEALDRKSDYRLLKKPGRTGQWNALKTILRNQIRERNLLEASCNCLASFGGPRRIKEELTGILLNRDRWMTPLVIGEYARNVSGKPPKAMLDLYYASEIKRGKQAPGASDRALRMAASFPKEWKEEDLKHISEWCLERLFRAGFQYVAPVFRSKLAAEGMSYPEKLNAVNFLISYYDSEKKLINAWCEKQSTWKRKVKKPNREIAIPEPSAFIDTAKDKRYFYGLIPLDFPRSGSLWIYRGKPRKEKGEIYYTGHRMKKGDISYISEELHKYMNLPKEKRKKLRRPVILNPMKGKLVFRARMRDEKVLLLKLHWKKLKKDRDKDGWTDFEEKSVGLKLKKKDSDKDGIPDGQDTNPMVSAKKKPDTAQQVAQAVYLHRHHRGVQNRGIDMPVKSYFSRVHRVDFGSISPVELPSAGEIILPVREVKSKKGGKRRVVGLASCSFVHPDNRLDGAPPKSAVSDGGVVYYSKDGTEAWVGLSCSVEEKKKKTSNYHLRQLEKSWIVLDAHDRPPEK